MSNGTTRPWWRDGATAAADADADADGDDLKKGNASSHLARGASSAPPPSSSIESEPKKKTVVVVDDVERRRRRLEEDNLSARIASYEAIEIGRATTERVELQSEQIAYADDLADRTSSILDKSHRTLRGMTWPGWIANKFSSSNVVRVRDPDDPAERLRRQAAGTTDGAEEDHDGADADVPERFRAAREAVTNYARNVRVLEKCETSEQRCACSAACDRLRRRAADELQRLQSAALDGGDDGAVYGRLARELARIGEAQARAEGRSVDEQGSAVAIGAANERRDVPPLKQKSNRTPLRCDDETEEHLSILSRNLTELQSIGENLRESIFDQNDALDVLNDKSDSLVDRTKMVTRRADRLARKATWRPEPAEFLAWHAIRRVDHDDDADQYLAATPDGSIVLVNEFTPYAAWGFWKRGKCVVGLQNRSTRNYIGQSMWTGKLVCTSYDFGKREELEVPEDAMEDEEGTTILCASANWGSGGYVRVRSDDASFEIIGGGSDGGRKKASLWRFVELDA